jgi:hypothetical protein
MAHEHQTSVVEAPKGAKAGSVDKCVIHHPQKGKPVKVPFVASGLAPTNKKIDFVFGRLVDQTTGHVFPGKTLPFPDIHRWAILFKKDPNLVLSDPFTLEVYGMAIDAKGKPAVVWQCSLTMPKPSGKIQFQLVIGWPVSNENDLCPSNFVPYGTYDTPGTIAVTLSGGVSIPPPAVPIYYDPTGGIWAAQFDPFAQPGSACQLDATLTKTTGGVDTALSKTGLAFQNC